MGLLKGKLGAEQTGPLWSGKEKEQLLEEENKAHRHLFCEGMMFLLLLRLIMVMIWNGCVSLERPSLHNLSSQRLHWRSQGFPNLAVIGENKIKTVFSSSALSSPTLREIQQKGNCIKSLSPLPTVSSALSNSLKCTVFGRWGFAGRSSYEVQQAVTRPSPHESCL